MEDIGQTYRSPRERRPPPSACCAFRSPHPLAARRGAPYDPAMTAPAAAIDIALRPAALADLDAIARVMNEPPEPPSAVLMGAGPASRLGALFVRAGISITLPQTTVAVLDGRVVGVMECGRQDPSKLTAARRCASCRSRCAAWRSSA
jgi:hypothetical protein